MLPPSVFHQSFVTHRCCLGTHRSELTGWLVFSWKLYLSFQTQLFPVPRVLLSPYPWLPQLPTRNSDANSTAITELVLNQRNTIQNAIDIVEIAQS